MILHLIARSVGICQIKKQNNQLSIAYIQMMNHYVLILWLMIMNLFNIIRKSNPLKCVKAVSKILKLPNLESLNLQPIQLRKKRTRLTRFTWMEVYRSQNNNLFHFLKRKKIKYTWDRILSNKIQKDKIPTKRKYNLKGQQLQWNNKNSANLKFSHKGLPLHWGRIKIQATLLRIKAAPYVLQQVKCWSLQLSNV